MINLTFVPTTLLKQKRNNLSSDITIEIDSNSSQGDTFTIHRPKKSPFVLKQKKMSMDTYEDSTLNISSKIGCNCKNSQCLKRYCECFSRMKLCDSSVCCCQNCKNTTDRKV